jgi:hypothetical protein
VVAVQSKEVEVVVSEPLKEVAQAPTNISLTPELQSNCSGGGCSCGCSGFDGATNSVSNGQSGSGNDKLIILGMFGFVSILALVLITKNK